MLSVTESVSSLYTANESFVSSLREVSTRQPTEPQRKRGFYGITIEPSMIFYTFAMSLSKVFVTNIMIDKVCLNYYHYSEYVCKNLDSNNFTEEQHLVQKVTNRYITYQTMIHYIPGIYFTLVMANWIQYKGKVLPLVLCHGSQLVQSVIYIANSYWFSLHPAWLLLADVPQGLSGGLLVTVMTTYAIVAENSTSRSRTLRLTLVQTLFDLSFPLGYYLGSSFFSFGGYILVFGVQLFVNILDLTYILLFSLICTRELQSDESYCEIISTEGSRVQVLADDLVEVGLFPSKHETKSYSPLVKIFSPLWMIERVKIAFNVEKDVRIQLLGLCVVQALISFALGKYLPIFSNWCD